MIYIALAELMEEKHISQTALETKGHIARQTIKAYKENTLIQFDLRTIEKLCAALDCKPSDLIRFKE